MYLKKFIASVDEIIDSFKEKTGYKPPPKIISLYEKCLETRMKGIPTPNLKELATLSFDPLNSCDIMERIWSDLKEIRQAIVLKKILILIEYLIIHGNPNIEENCKVRSHIRILSNIATNYNILETAKYHFSKDIDVGAAVRKKTSEILELVQNGDVLNDKRDIANKLNQRFGRSTTEDFQRDFSPSHRPEKYSDDVSRPKRYSDSPLKGSKAWDFGGEDHVKHPPNVLQNSTSHCNSVSLEQIRVAEVNVTRHHNQIDLTKHVGTIDRKRLVSRVQSAVI